MTIPGAISITRTGLSYSSSRKVAAIEVDPVLVHYLRQKFRDALDAGRLELIEGDVLKTDLKAEVERQLEGRRFHLAANLPYYITTPVLAQV